MNPRLFNRAASRRSAICHLSSALVLAVTCLAAGCSGGETTWSTEVRSPDAQWNAIGRTDRYSGPGNAAVMTGVYLQRVHGDKRDEPVLRFSDDQSPADARVIPVIKWLTPTHLQVDLSRHVDLDLQVVRYAGIEISVREPSSVTSSN